MRSLTPWLLPSLLLAGLAARSEEARGLASSFTVPIAHADDSAPRAPVLVELFTSEGCSSCPPAEEELLRLDAEQPIAGVRVVALAFHVDYWNDLGWPDPFSSAAWTARQRMYASDGRMYTPQAVVQGEHECVGTDDGAIRTFAMGAASHAAPRVSVTTAQSPDASRLRVSVDVAAMPPVGAGDRAAVWVALVERGVVQLVPRGENGGRRLSHAPLARALVNAGAVSGNASSLQATLGLPPAIPHEALTVVAFVQEERSRRVLGVATSAL